MNYGFKSFFVLAIATLSVVPVSGDRIYEVRASLDLPVSVDNNPAVAGLGMTQFGNQKLNLLYGFYPSVLLNSGGSRWDYELSCALGFNQVEGSNLDLSSQSQAFEGKASAVLTPNLKLKLSEAFVRSPDFITFNLLRGNVSTAEGIFPRSDIVAVRRQGYSNTATANLDYAFNSRSGLLLTFGHLLRRFEGNPAFPNQLSDQSVSSGNAVFTRRVNRRISWNVGYSIYQYTFRDFGDARTQSAELGVSHQVRPTVLVSLSAGPSYTQSQHAGSNFSGYNTYLSVAKALRRDQVTITYQHRDGSTYGIGSISDIQDLAVSYVRSLGKRTRLNGEMTLYSARQRLDNPVESTGFSGSLILNYVAGARWALSFGGSYQKQNGTDIFNLQRTRVFASIRLMLPELLRFEK